jgi:excisionase family DNA binding protein
VNDRERLVTADEAAHYLGLKVSTIRRLTIRGELPVVRPTGRRAVRYRLQDLEDLARMRTQPMRGPRQMLPVASRPHETDSDVA